MKFVEGESEQFLVNERSLNDNGRRWSAFAGTSRFFGSKIQLRAFFIGDRTRTRARSLFEGDRTRPLASTQVVSSDTPMFFSLSVERQF
ncbi:MAG: hypothetical protein AAFN07_08590 [Pseudomonadota bacterium]